MKRRIIRRIAQGFAQPHDCGIQAVIKIYEGIIGPKPFSEILTSDDFAAPFQQDRRESGRVALEADLPALLPKLTRA